LAHVWCRRATGCIICRPRQHHRQFSDADLRHLDQAFPLLLKQLELMLLSGELNPRHQHCVTLYAKGLICEADSLGSHGYVYLAIYPTPATTE
jgi:cytoskeleton bundling-enhancing protein CbeA-like protein